MKQKRHQTQVRTPSGWRESAQEMGKAKPELQAFTLIECLAIIAALGLLACVALPVLAGTKSDTQRIACVNNLRQIGAACAAWRNEHGELLPAQVSTIDGGLSASEKQDAWRHFNALSNQLATPRLLVCPSDPQTKVASGWTQSPTGIILPGGLGDKAVSYAVGLHAFPDYPMELVASDRYFESVSSTVCGLHAIRAEWLVAQGTNQSPAVRTGWFRSAGHDGTGNLLLNDGQVLQTTSEGLQSYLARPGHSEAREHVIRPLGK